MSERESCRLINAKDRRMLTLALWGMLWIAVGASLGFVIARMPSTALIGALLGFWFGLMFAGAWPP